MSTTVPITFERHAAQRWLRPAGHSFTAQDATALLTLAELPQAALHLPIAFVLHEEMFLPVAVLGLAPGKNLFVALDGRWVGGYVPAVYSAYPFALAPAAEGKVALCINEASGLLSSGAGEPFFTDGGVPNPAVAEVLGVLNQQVAQQQATARVCALLAQHQLIEPWAITLQGGAEQQAVTGLHRISERLLNQLAAPALVELRNAGALAMAYCQMLSMQHLQMLGKLADAHAQAAANAAAAAAVPVKGKELDLSFLEGSQTLKFF